MLPQGRLWKTFEMQDDQRKLVEYMRATDL